MDFALTFVYTCSELFSTELLSFCFAPIVVAIAFAVFVGVIRR